ncbi:MAG: sulfatase-like hydrolase/transferase [Acidobacteriota bacterium]
MTSDKPLPSTSPVVGRAWVAFWLSLAALCSDLPAAHASQQKQRPNILVIYGDDLGWSDVGFNGRTEWRTPNLDRLARQGTVFRRWYTAAVVCAPSRAALMTGRYGIHNGVSGNSADLPSAEITIAEALRSHGYATALFGKWHHGTARPGQASYVHPLDQGFDEFFGFTNATHAWEKFPTELWFGRDKKPVQGFADTLFTDRAIDFVERQRDRPFFLYLAYTTPHFNVEATEADLAVYRGKFAEKDANRPVNAAYAAMITRMDREVGRILATIEKQGLARNTLVVFSSDHGATFETGNQGTSAYHDSNRPFRGQKRTLWEGGIRVPAIVRWPGMVPAGKVSTDIVHMIDVLPTLLAAAGAAPDPAWRVDGISLLDVWRGQATAPQRTLFWEWRAEGYYQLAAMRGDKKLVVTGAEDSKPELFNVETDAAERRSIFFEFQPLGRRLHEELKAWLASETEESKWGRTAR